MQAPDDFVVFRQSGGLAAVVAGIVHVQDAYDKMTDRRAQALTERADAEVLTLQQRRLTYALWPVCLSLQWLTVCVFVLICGLFDWCAGISSARCKRR
jgi:hypothetical protein